MTDVSQHPAEGFRVDRLAYRVHQPDCAGVVFLDPVFAVPHEAADGGGRCVEDVDAVSFYDRDPPVGFGIVQCAFVHEACYAFH